MRSSSTSSESVHHAQPRTVDETAVRAANIRVQLGRERQERESRLAADGWHPGPPRDVESGDELRIVALERAVTVVTTILEAAGLARIDRAAGTVSFRGDVGDGGLVDRVGDVERLAAVALEAAGEGGQDNSLDFGRLPAA